MVIKISWAEFDHSIWQRIMNVAGDHYLYKKGRRNLKDYFLVIEHDRVAIRSFLNLIVDRKLEVKIPCRRFSSYEEFLRKIRYAYYCSNFDFTNETDFLEFRNQCNSLF